jgi:hypothetical protein
LESGRHDPAKGETETLRVVEIRSSTGDDENPVLVVELA